MVLAKAWHISAGLVVVLFIVVAFPLVFTTTVFFFLFALLLHCVIYPSELDCSTPVLMMQKHAFVSGLYAPHALRVK